MRDIGKRTTVYKCRIVFQRLNEIRLHGIFKQDSHGAVRLDITAVNRSQVTLVGNDDAAKALL